MHKKNEMTQPWHNSTFPTPLVTRVALIVVMLFGFGSSTLALPANGKIAFTSQRDGNREIYLMYNDGTNHVRLTNNAGADDFAAWSPDGNRLAFLSQTSGTFSIKLMNADGTGVTELTPVAFDGDFDALYNPRWGMNWSPDGKKIAFSSGHEIFVINTDGSNRVNLTNDVSRDAHPTWSPDGTRIIFSSNRANTQWAFRLYSMNADGSNQTALPGGSDSPNQGDVDPAWSPDGLKLAGVQTWLTDVSFFFIRNLTGEVTFTDSTIDRDSSTPAWSPDGAKILFSAVINPYFQSSNVEIFVVNADGTGLKRLTNTGGYEAHPSWQPLISNCPNAIDCAEFFIRQHYQDFLGREPDAAGLAGWMNVINSCGTSVAQPCDRTEISSAFFRSAEFQGRGYYIYRFYSSVGKVPIFEEFMPDFAKVSGYLTDVQLEANKSAYVNEFMARAQFQNRYGSTFGNPTGYVDSLLQTVGLPNHPSRGGWIASLNSSNTHSNRATVLRQLVESAEVYQKYFNEAFVIMQYFGYLRRSADALYLSWIQTMNSTGGDYRIMINGFINSVEYRRRFGP